MIWVAKSLEHWTETLQPESYAESVMLDGMEYRKLTPHMFGMLYQHMRESANRGTLTADNVKRFTEIEQTIKELGLEREYYANVAQKA